MRLRALPILLCPLLLLAACGGGSSSAAGGLPTVSGSYGHKPTITTSGQPPNTLQDKVLHQGSGPVVAKGDLLVADYLGKIWGGKVFDNSYDRGVPTAFPIGVGQVIPGWDKTLVGVKAGSRVLMVLPPADGYGSKGNSQAGITGKDTLIFVVDVIASYGKNAAGQANAVRQPAPKAAPQVAGALGAQPKVSVPKGLAQPKRPTAIVLAKGSGPALQPGLAILQIEAVSWTNQPDGSTWQSGQPAGIPVGQVSQPSPFDQLVGTPVGSRVLLEVPANSAQGQPAAAAVIDIVAEAQPAGAATS